MWSRLVRAVMRDKRVVNRLKLQVIPSIRHGALDQFADAVADKHAHLVHRVRRQTVFRQRRVCARRQIIQRVEQRAIQIPNTALIFMCFIPFRFRALLYSMPPFSSNVLFSFSLFAV